MPKFTAEERRALAQEAVSLSAQGANDTEIGRMLGVDPRTAKKYIADELALRAEMRDNDIERHLAVYTEVQRVAWKRLQETKMTSVNSAGLLNVVKAAEDSKVKLTGAEAAREHNVNVNVTEAYSDEEMAFLETVRELKENANAN